MQKRKSESAMKYASIDISIYTFLKIHYDRGELIIAFIDIDMLNHCHYNLLRFA